MPAFKEAASVAKAPVQLYQPFLKLKIRKIYCTLDTKKKGTLTKLSKQIFKII